MFPVPALAWQSGGGLPSHPRVARTGTDQERTSCTPVHGTEMTSDGEIAPRARIEFSASKSISLAAPAPSPPLVSTRSPSLEEARVCGPDRPGDPGGPRAAALGMWREAGV